MKETIAEVVQREIRLAGLFTDREPLPPIPCDLDAEAELCSAVMSSVIKTVEIDFLASNFYSTFHRYVWVAVEAIQQSGLEPTDSAILAAFSELGFSGKDLNDELNILRNAQPYVSRGDLQTRASKISRLADDRRLIAQLEQLSVEIRFGAPREYVREILLKIAGR